MSGSSTSATFDVAIIGAGVVGCAIARELARYELSVVVVERAGDVGDGTSKANTALLHTGFDCVPGSLESTLVTRGYTLLRQYAADASIAVERTGALLVAWDETQLRTLGPLQEKAVRNGYTYTNILPVEEVARREPHLGEGALGGLEVPDESIICPWSTVLAYAREANSAGVMFLFNSEVTKVDFGAETTTLATSTGGVRADWVINAAGLSSGKINDLCEHDDFKITPRRGELIVFDKLSRQLVSSILLPVPTTHSKGVLVAPTVYGNVILGPTADDVEDPYATATTEQGLSRLLSAGRKILPRLLDEEVTATYAGLRAATQYQDYQIHADESQHYIGVGGIRSTGLTASLAIAEYVVSIAHEGGLALKARTEVPVIPQMPPLGESQLRRYLDTNLIALDPEYGKIVCHCERVTMGEIRDACSSPLPAVDVGSLRRRTRALNGRCQGFYCAAEVIASLADLTSQDVKALVGLGDS